MRCNDSNPAVIYDILERLARFLEQSRGPRLPRSKLDTGGEGGIVHAFDENWPSAIVDHGNDAGPMIMFCLGFGSGYHFTRCGQRDDFLLRELCGRACGGEYRKPE